MIPFLFGMATGVWLTFGIIVFRRRSQRRKYRAAVITIPIMKKGPK